MFQTKISCQEYFYLSNQTIHKLPSRRVIKVLAGFRPPSIQYWGHKKKSEISPFLIFKEINENLVVSFHLIIRQQIMKKQN